MFGGIQNRIFGHAWTAILVFLCCSCRTPETVPLPRETSFNPNAGRREDLFLTLRMEDQKDLMFIVDTGQPFTMMDKSLEPVLGKCVFTNKAAFVWYPDLEFHTYRAPGLFLGNTRLKIGPWMRTADLGRVFSQSGDTNMKNIKVSGVLGMDCLRNYCLQMDFVTHRMRFLDPNGLNARDPQLGRAFPLIYSNGRMCIQADLFGGKKMKCWVDTGDPNDFILAPELFEKACQDQKDAKVGHFNTPRGTRVGVARLPHGIFAGKPCTDLLVIENPETKNSENTIGMRFLARHLVTLNIPKGVLYLKPESEGPLK